MPNSVKARLKKLEDRVQVFAPDDPQRVCYLLVRRLQYEEAMASFCRRRLGNLSLWSWSEDRSLSGSS
jgi:hypothetical protein